MFHTVLGPIWGCGAFAKKVLLEDKSTFNVCGEHNSFHLGVELLAIKVLSAGAQN